MVTADNLNYDILALIFAYLARDELVSISLVSRSFWQGALPHLYHTLVYRIAHKKKYPKMMTPFQTILLHPNLAVHVRCCELSALPVEKGVPRCDFMTQCVSALEKSPNLVGFYCTTNVLASFVQLLPQKKRLKNLHVHASLTPSQTDILTQVSGLEKLRLDGASWCVVDALPNWIDGMRDTLKSLSIQLSNELNKTVLSKVLQSLPNLTCLHVRSCPKIDHYTLLGLVSHNYRLEELSFTTWESMSMNAPMSTSLNNLPAYLHSLKTLSIDTRNLIPTAGPPVWSSILGLTRRSNSPLQTLSLRMCESATMPASLIDDLLTAHADTLASLRVVNCTVPLECLEKICRKCVGLEKLCIAIPGKQQEIVNFSRVLAPSKTLRVLVDETEQLRSGDVQLDHHKVRKLMERVPSLRKLISDRRCWMGETKDNGKYHLSFMTLPQSTLQVK